jgi:hypothetical protein
MQRPGTWRNLAESPHVYPHVMRKLGSGAAVALLGVLLTACSDGASDSACTMIGSVHGLQVTVAPELAPVDDLQLELCQNGSCRTRRVLLEPGSTYPADCNRPEPDPNCSVTVAPDGTQSGFIAVELSEGTAEVSGQYRRSGRTVDLGPALVDVETSYPNGPACGADGTRARVTLGQVGLG